jgi:predicted transcriptional regulator
MFNDLDPILHSQLRLAVVSLLIGLEEAEFVYLKEKTKSSAGNLSLQIDKLNTAGYIKVRKAFKGKYPVTICKITPKGLNAFENYVASIKAYIKVDRIVFDFRQFLKSYLCWQFGNGIYISIANCQTVILPFFHGVFLPSIDPICQ